MDILYKKGGPFRGKSRGPYRGPKAIPYSYLPVDNEEERKAALDDGWFPSIPEAIVGKPKPEAPKEEGMVKYEDLTPEKKKEIMEHFFNGEDAKATRKKFNIHHYTLKKLSEEFDGVD